MKLLHIENKALLPTEKTNEYLFTESVVVSF